MIKCCKIMCLILYYFYKFQKQMKLIYFKRPFPYKLFWFTSCFRFFWSAPGNKCECNGLRVVVLIWKIPFVHFTALQLDRKRKNNLHSDFVFWFYTSNFFFEGVKITIFFLRKRENDVKAFKFALLTYGTESHLEKSEINMSVNFRWKLNFL
jgi:hypothetical protein